MPAVTAPDRPRRRRAPDFDHVLFVRKVKGRKYQLRWWLRGHGSVGLGLYDRELALVVRRAVVRETRHHPDSPLGLWCALRAVLGRLSARGAAVPDVLPKYVYRRRDGRGYGGRARFGKPGARRLVELAGPFPTPEAAHLAFVATIS